MPHGRQIYAKVYDMEKQKMCVYPQTDHALPHRKCVMQCCAKYPNVNLHDQETDYQYSNAIPSVRFHIYHLIARCTTHGRLLLTDKNIFCKCKQDTVSDNRQKYTLENI